MPPRLDSQQIESLGRAALTAQLVGDALEVAQPERDAGIDLLAFTIEPWRVIPIQMKVASAEGFSVARKYRRVPGLVNAPLVMVYVWKARSPADIEFYAMTWNDAVAIAEELGWTRTRSWQRDPWWTGSYETTRPSQRVKSAIARYRMAPGRWRELIETCWRSVAEEDLTDSQPLGRTLESEARVSAVRTKPRATNP